MTEKKPYTGECKMRAGKRTVQFYGLRRRFEWELSIKTRDTTQAMRLAWGHEMDVVTLLGIKCKPRERDWRRYDEHYEMVDLGRNKKKAGIKLYVLQKEAEEEKRLRKRAALDLEAKLTKELEEFVEARKKHNERFSGSVQRQGIVWAALYDDIEDVVCADYYGRWAKQLLGEEEEGSIPERLHAEHERVSKILVDNGGAPEGYDEIAQGVTRGKLPALLSWRNDTLAGWLRRITRWEDAKATMAARQVDRVADKLSAMSLLK